MKKNRSYNFHFSIQGRVNIDQETVGKMIAVAKEALEEKAYGWQMIHNALDGQEPSEANFDKLFAASARKGFRDEFRKNTGTDFDGLIGRQIEVNVIPRGCSISKGEQDDE